LLLIIPLFYLLWYWFNNWVQRHYTLSNEHLYNNWERTVLNQLSKANIFMIWPIEVFISNPLWPGHYSWCTFLTWTIRWPMLLILEAQYRVWIT
jgi:hypothetical protein